MHNYKAIISYDGTNYHGYAKQLNKVTIQSQIEDALEFIFRQKIKVNSSGRTDRYVHAIGQVINFKTDVYIKKNNLIIALNNQLPNDIRIKLIEEVDINFHARFMTKSKTYMYVINNGNYDLFRRNYELFVKTKINIELLKKTAEKFVGTHNFSSFSTTKKMSKIRTIKKIEIIDSSNNLIFIKITADGFLKYMVRMIIGKLIQINFGKEDNISYLLNNPKKGSSLYKEKSHALYLLNVEY
ncbi:MAG: tRNA pseudouridine(38-40) synthase TruA [Mycoplasmoidaceae bacterium]